MERISLKGVIDLHVHSNPDVRFRAYDDFELMEAGIRVGARAIVIKSHQGSTVERAYLCNRYNERIHSGGNDFVMFGGITLNRHVGGINPAAVENALKLGGKIVWLPTLSTRNHMLKLGTSTDGCVDVVRDGKIVPELKDVLRLVKDHGVILATGHLSPQECVIVVEAARAMGVRKIVVSHPEWWIVGMSLEQQLRMVRDYDVYLERCFAQNMGGGRYKSNLPDNLEAIRTCGYRNVLISTDGGQVENPHWEIALERYIQFMAEHGIPAQWIHHMTHDAQASLLGLTDAAP